MGMQRGDMREADPIGFAAEDAASDYLTLDVFAGEPALFRRMHERGSRGGRLLLIPLALLAVIVSASAAEGSLYAPHIIDVDCRDLANLFHLHQLACYGDAGTQPAVFPLLRDLPSLALALIVSITPFLVYRQWRVMSNIYVDLAQKGAVILPEQAERRENLRTAVCAANVYFRRAGTNGALYAAAASVCVLLVAVAASRDGIYRVYAPDSGSLRGELWARAAYDNWWANFNNHWVGWLAYVVVGGLGLFYIFLMDVIGWRFVLFVWRTRSYLDYAVDVDNCDGAFGWRQGRSLVLVTYTAVLLHGLALALVAAMLPVAIAAIFMVVPLLLWLVTLPLAVLVPASIIGPQVRRFKEAEIGRLTLLLDELRAHRDPEVSAAVSDREHLAARISRIRAMPHFPLFRLRDSALLLFGAISGIASIYATVVLIVTQVQ